MIYQARLKNGDPVGLLFLFEHKSTRPDYPVHLQLLDYIKQLWEDDLCHGRPPSLITSIVLYHGERPWVHKTLAVELSGKPPKSLYPYIPNFRYIAINLLSESPDWSDARVAALADTTEEQVAHIRRQSASRKGDPPPDN